MNNQGLLYKVRSLRDALDAMAENARDESDVLFREPYNSSSDHSEASRMGGEADGLATAASLLDGLIVEAGKA